MEEDYWDSELIILEVEKYPNLYDTRHGDFKNRELKRDAWMAVSKKVIGEKWDQMNEERRSMVGKEIQKRWKSMKDSFLKSIKNDVGRSSDARKTKKPYVYHKQMAFLQAVYEQRETLGKTCKEEVIDTEASEASSSAASTKEICPYPTPQDIRTLGKTCKEEVIDTEASEASSSAASTKEICPYPAPQDIRIQDQFSIEYDTNPQDIDLDPPQSKFILEALLEAPSVRTDEPATVTGPCSRMPNKRKSNPLEKEIPNVLEANLEHQPKKLIQDPDEMFLLSQLPHIKKMKPSDKLQFQIEFMQLIQKYSNPNPNSFELSPYSFDAFISTPPPVNSDFSSTTTQRANSRVQQPRARRKGAK